MSVALQSEVSDQRLNGIFITDVKVDRELDFANIYFSSLEGHDSAKETLEALNHARGFLKFRLAEQIDLRVVPKLRFFYDPTPERAERIDSILAEIRETDITEDEDEEERIDE